MALPAEIMNMVLAHLSVSDLMRVARTNKTLAEMVREDTRWVRRLKSMGAWDEGAARRAAAAEAQAAGAAAKTKAAANSGQVVFDADKEAKAAPGGFKTEGVVGTAPIPEPRKSIEVVEENPEDVLTVLSRTKSIRGRALQEYARVHKALYPYYADLVQSASQSNPLLFRRFGEPEQQARMLAQLRAFARADADSTAMGGAEREARVQAMENVFEQAALREFQHALRVLQAVGGGDGDISRIKRYASVLTLLNGGKAAVESWVEGNPVLQRARQDVDRSGRNAPAECVLSAFPGHVNLAPAEEWFKALARAVNGQAAVAASVFPPGIDVITPLVDRIGSDVLESYMTVLLQESKQRNGVEAYLKAVSGSYMLAIRFAGSLNPGPAHPNPKLFSHHCRTVVWQCYDSQVNRYLNDEVDWFTTTSQDKVQDWERQLQEQEHSTEEFFFSNVSRQAAKQDFLSSFKSMLMLPVNAVSSLGGTTKKTPISAFTGTDTGSSRSSTPLPNLASPPREPTPTDGRSTPGLSGEAPTTELAAKAAMMNFRLQGIKTLFSMQVALDLVQAAKASLERIVPFSRFGDQKITGPKAREQCEAVFVTLVKTLGQRHVRQGFDKAVGHLSNYDGKQNAAEGGMSPLVTFLELVNVGDLIQQMVEVFYVQELVQPKLSDPDDFLGAAVKEKKRFEQMLDESVAAGLNKGIDVLMDEVEVICATTQDTADFYPERRAQADARPGGSSFVSDVGPTETAKKVVELVGSHVSMLVGSTDKSVLDVFDQEVGLRLFTVLCKHIKRQRISVEGAIKFIR
jgi:recyclin-1